MSAILFKISMALCLLFICIEARANEAVRALEERVSRRLHAELSSRLTEEMFFLEVRIEKVPDSKPKSKPFIPDFFTSPENSVLGPDLSGVTKMIVTLYVDHSIGEGQKEILQVIIRNALNLSRDKLNLTVKPLSFPKAALEAAHEKEKSNLGQKVSELEMREKTLERERNDIKAELTQTKSDLENARSQLSILSGGAASGSLASRLMNLLFQSSIWVILVLITLTSLLGAVIYLRSGFVSSTTALAKSFSEIARALSEAGTSDALIDVTPEREKLPAPGHDALLPAGSVNMDRLTNLRNELGTSLREVDEQYTVHYLNQLLNDEESAAKGVYIMELMPREIARELFEKLGITQKQKVSKFLMLKDHPKNKAELMLEAGEEFLTRLLKGHLGAIEQHLNQSLITKVELLSGDLRLNVARKLPDESATRFLLYLQADAISELLESLAQIDASAYEKLALDFARVSEFETRDDLDVTIEAAIEEVLAEEAENTEKRYLPLFKAVLSSLKDDDTEKFMEIIQNKKSTLYEQLNQSIITVSTFFKLTSSYQEEMIDGLSNRELAVLSTILSETQQEKLESLLGDKVKELYFDEKERLSQRAKAMTKKQAEAARAKLTQRISDLIKIHGSLAALCADDVEANYADNEDKHEEQAA